MTKFRTFAAILAAFVVAVLALAAPASATTTKTITENSGVNFADTREAGHYDFQADGLHVWTDDATSKAKVAGYIAANISLGSVAAGSEPELKWTGTAPGPGYQLVGVTAEGKGFILVGEPAAYGNKWWISDAYCAIEKPVDNPDNNWCDQAGITFSGGGGSAHSATLAQWSDGLKGAKITGIGFSLGSGVKGAGVIAHLKLAGVVYVFCKDKPKPTSTTPTTTSSATPTTSATPTDSATPTPTTTRTSSTGFPGVVTVVNPGQVSVIPDTSKGIDTGDGSSLS